MTGKEAALKLTLHHMQCGMLMPIEWVKQNGEGSELSEVFRMATAALREQESLEKKQATSDWISVEEAMPDQFVSVLGYMTDAGEFPPVRECYLVGGAFFFPALRDVHPVSHWIPMPKKEDT